ncbi:MAG TPA: NifU family protein [Phycisphaerales bacterium]|nr:NifU family protein [Phycisphaerales bacterium]HIB00889.1 NifU family protein [Phycisphaerales bacterium]HIB49956.1 NifU family protein [Phycisphaerales bacterium]HIN84536.1 NifU family protein [Phycisphaerales bacterium]HIO19577.1 NifU family protein [Phycisphaerales bacterium]
MTNENTKSNSPIFDEVNAVIELIRPAIQADGGDIELVAVDASGVVSIRFLGACIGCPSLGMTLQTTIETTLKDRITVVTCVEAVE